MVHDLNGGLLGPAAKTWEEAERLITQLYYRCEIYIRSQTVQISSANIGFI
jgi:hypothetical protein